MSIKYDPNYKSPCLSCKYKIQACVYILDGQKADSACMEQKIWLDHQKTKPIEIPCCDNCDCFEERDNVQLGEWTTVPTCCGKIISESTPMVTRGHGCLSHPRAREYINRDVIEELRKLRDSYFEDSQSNIDEKLRYLSKGYSSAYKHSINLMKCGNEKE